MRDREDIKMTLMDEHAKQPGLRIKRYFLKRKYLVRQKEHVQSIILKEKTVECCKILLRKLNNRIEISNFH